MLIESKELMRRIKSYIDTTSNPDEQKAYLNVMEDINDIVEFIMMDMEKEWEKNRKEKQWRTAQTAKKN